MKEFEKWWGKFTYVEKDMWLYRPTYDDAEAAWKAALKWVLSIDSGFCSCGCPNDSADNPSVLNQIEEELKDES